MAAYKAGKNSTVTINGTLMAVEDGNWDATSATDETSNLNDGGFYSSVNTLKKASGNLKCVYDGDEPPDFDEGDSITMVIAHASGPGISGTFNVTKMSYAAINPKGAVKYNFDFENVGAYVKSGGAP